MVILRAKRNRLDVVKHLQQRIFIKHVDYLVYWPFVAGYASYSKEYVKLECGPMPNVMAALPNIVGALCPTPQSLADAQYWSAVH